MKKVLWTLFLLGTYLSVFAQDIQVKGLVLGGADNEPLPGVNVIVKGVAGSGTITDLEGRFTLTVPTNAVLSISYVGYQSQDVAVNGQRDLRILLKEDTETLDEVVVIGYGVQKKSVVTAAIARVSADELSATAPVRVDNALKGLAAGVQVTSASGQPGEAARVRVRGIGTINNSDPLYIVDGMPIDKGGIDYLNPNDIQSIEVLKDAASAAVYGARAANGVVLVTTKSGKEGKVRVSYDFSYGWQSPWRERDVLNATEYALMMNEGSLNAGGEILHHEPYSYGKGTNWQKETFNYDAPVVNHQLGVSGGTEKVSYFFSLGYYSQEGIVGGNYNRSNYKRMSLRSNTTYTLFDEMKERNWLNKLVVTSNLAYTRVKAKGISTNSEFGSPLGSALAMSPILPVYAEDEEAALAPYVGNKDFTPVRDPNTGKLYTIAGAEYNEITNPLAQLSLPGDQNWTDKFVANFTAEFTLWDHLKFKSSYGADLAFWGKDGWTKKYYLNSNNKATRSSVLSETNRSLTWQVENVLSYDKTLGEHNFSIVLGQSAQKTKGRQLGGSNYDMIEEDGSKANISFTTGLRENGDMAVYGGANDPHTMASYFGRISYNYAERYMLQATVRRDGSSNFGPNNHYATFPSFSLGWNLTNEKFLEKRPEWWNTTKVRYSWGKNGNESIGAFGYVALTATGNNYIFGKGEQVTVGTKPSVLPNRDLRWEESVQNDFGMDFGFLNNALTFSVDYYVKKTNGMLMTMPLPSYVGEAKPTGNVGEMKNSGWEFEMAYRFRTGDWNFRLGANASYLKNELVNLGNDTGYANYDSMQGLGTFTRAENGQPFPYFYGYKTNGIFQNMNEIQSYVHTDAEGNTTLIQPNANPGDVRFVDLNGDGKIDENDRTHIGNGTPDWTYGINVNVSWKNFDFSMMWQGTAGNDVFDATRRVDVTYSNLPAYMLNRWTGEGTSNKYPRFVFGDNVNWQSSDLYVKDGSYFRLKNIQLGYTLPTRWTAKAFISSFRVYVAAENLLTFTKYDGFDPEISSGGTSLGVDRGVYPQARTWTVGANISF